MIDSNFLGELIEKPYLLSELHLDAILKIINDARKVFENENLLLEFDLGDSRNEVYVIGDIHGNLETLLKLFNIIQTQKPYGIIFLGDLVDRGPKQIECLIFVLILKILYPRLYYVLRGNHETLEMNQYYGFFQEFSRKFNVSYVFNEILEVYNVLPICATVNRIFLCLHGGIPQDDDILKKIKNIKTKDLDTIYQSTSRDLYQIMWNDPKENMRGFSESFRGPGIKFFGEDVFDKFLQENNLRYIIRAHECFPEGYRWFFKDRLLSIFSSAKYRGMHIPNPASYAIIKDDKVIPKLLRI